ncbi:hypothetical protein AWM79_15660 [Pseudomonas agarici]|uniref:Uncharacterized protein n=1 Tax=Pseudomonas agarici TaxID=46677 RepID=A0A0X1T3K9_PSEAA|nr:hypothetical protein [Pseudomonas agarici]AMB86663.1 hypothetical protein AWM79_15660 [Pseudomonas agarici]
MSVKTLRAEIKRIAEKVGANEEMILLIVLVVANCSKTPMNLPEKVGHVVDYRIAGVSVPLYFPFCEMNSAEAEEMAKAMIAHVINAERTGYRPQVGVMDMRTFAPPGAWVLRKPADGMSLPAYVAEQYLMILGSRE